MKYSRRITEVLPKVLKRIKKGGTVRRVLREKAKKNINKEHFVPYFLNFVLFVLIIQALISIIIIVALNKVLVKSSEVNYKKQQTNIYWGSVAGQYPNAPDVLFNAAKSSYEIGDRQKALFYVEKSLKIDPLFDKAQKLKNEILKG